MKKLAASALVIACGVGCGGPTLNVSLLETVDECTIDDAAERTRPFLVDITIAEGLSAPIWLEHGQEPARAYTGEAAVVFALDDGELREVPRSAATARVEPVDQVADVGLATRVQPGFPAGPVLVSLWRAPILTAEEIAAFRDEPAVQAVLTTSSSRLPVSAVVTFTGSIARADGIEQLGDVVAIEPTTLTIPLELCSGCLAAPPCGGVRSVLRPRGCQVGVDQGPVCISSSQ